MYGQYGNYQSYQNYGSRQGNSRYDSYSNYQNNQRRDLSPLRRVSVTPITEVPRLKYNEIGIRSGARGKDINNYVDKAIQLLLDERVRTLGLRATGNACTRVTEIADRIRRKIKGVASITKSFNRRYVAVYQNRAVF